MSSSGFPRDLWLCVEGRGRGGDILKLVVSDHFSRTPSGGSKPPCWRPLPPCLLFGTRLESSVPVDVPGGQNKMEDGQLVRQLADRQDTCPDL